MKKIHWGILSTAKIGIEKVIPAMQQGKHCEMTAIASRTQASAREAAKHLKIPKAYGSYEELLDDASIDAVWEHLQILLKLRSILTFLYAYPVLIVESFNPHR